MAPGANVVMCSVDHEGGLVAPGLVAMTRKLKDYFSVQQIQILEKLVNFMESLRC